MINIIHITKTGDKMLVSQMDDEHLLNTIRLRLTRLVNAKAEFQPANYTERLLMVDMNFTPERMAEYTIKEYSNLAPYICEAVLRKLNLTEIGDLLQELFERSEALRKSKKLALPSSKSDRSLNDFFGDEDDSFYDDNQ